jgi:hypothetical protein
MKRLTLCALVLAGCGGSRAVTGPDPTPKPAPTPIDLFAPIRTEDFFVPAFPESLQLSTWLAHHVEGDTLYAFNWGAANTASFVTYEMRGNGIFIIEDRTWGYFENGREMMYRLEPDWIWFPAVWKPGQTVSNPASVIHLYDKATCAYVRDQAVPGGTMRFAEHRIQDLGGELGLTEVIEVTSPPWGEGYLYGRGLGLVGFSASPGQWSMANTFKAVSPPHPTGCRI